MTLTPEEIAELTADPSPLNPLPKFIPASPGEPGYGPGIGTAKTFDPFNQPEMSLAHRLGSFPAQVGIGALANAVIPGSGFLGMMGRTAAQGALGGGQAALEGRPMADVALGTGLGIAGQSLGELSGPLSKSIMTQSAGKKAVASNEAAQQAYEMKLAATKDRNAAQQFVYDQLKEKATGLNQAAREKFLQDASQIRGSNTAARRGFAQETQRIGAQNTAAEAAHQQAQGMFSDQAATRMRDYLAREVPDLADSPAGTRGLLDMVYGSGQTKLSHGFAEVEKDLLAQAKGQVIQLSPETAAVFGIKPSSGDIPEAARTVLKKYGANMNDPESVAQVAKLFHLEIPTPGYDAAQAIKAIKGKSVRNTEAYHDVLDALEDAGLKNEKAGPYKTAQAFISFLDKTNALEGEMLHPDRVLGGMTRLNSVNELRRRGEGNIFQGEMQASVRGGPGEFTSTEMPRRPIPQGPPARPGMKPMPTAPEYESMPKEPIPLSVKTGPLMTPWARHSIAFGVPAAAAHAMGGGPLGAAGAGSLGMLLGEKFLPQGKRFIEAPLSMRQKEWERLLPILTGALGAQGMEETFLGGMR